MKSTVESRKLYTGQQPESASHNNQCYLHYRAQRVFYQLSSAACGAGINDGWVRDGGIESRIMVLSAEAVIAIVGVFINIPTFVLVFWHMWVKRRRRSSSSHRQTRRDSESFEEHQLFDRVPLHPRHAFPWGQQPPMFAWYAMPWATPYGFDRRAL
ncbi:uncharacterized protein NECHADRAFT_84941 [Fusarium vanettenii 77-13-4]|uniref:Uncharacterized protein n=1 Tax=Fusarium vanettenii (strain ATCC MYA-4622 / CBS 123669 / FGSC 9596 / NRRL 45880 / 77-13-4) TaxID=660122 RepID=C7YUJ3_FUSV7|nr:uncharacterized protein NECHADRAFT_84941 [Fusarium vanettenii 77-13-4]EEU44420.1 predicted protein [Fusarium vanettenii 77-13-4]